jgi:hypothetical protein
VEVFNIRFKNDIVAMVFVGVYSIMGSYSNTLIYTYANAQVPPAYKAQSTSYLNFLLVIGAIVGLPVQFGLEALLRKMIPGA